MSCNGCRILRKGCSEDCTLKTSLVWIKSPNSQAYATAFLAKIYGRVGLINLLNNGPQHLRPAIFRSLMYEAVGRIINPIHGSVGLLWSGNWHQCQLAVESVLQGHYIMPLPAKDINAASHPNLFINGSGTCHFITDSEKFQPIQTRKSPTDDRGKEKLEPIQFPENAWVPRNPSQSIGSSMVSIEAMEVALGPRPGMGGAGRYDNRSVGGEVGLELSLGIIEIPKQDTNVINISDSD